MPRESLIIDADKAAARGDWPHFHDMEVVFLHLGRRGDDAPWIEFIARPNWPIFISCWQIKMPPVIYMKFGSGRDCRWYAEPGSSLKRWALLVEAIPAREASSMGI